MLGGDTRKKCFDTTARQHDLRLRFLCHKSLQQACLVHVSKLFCQGVVSIANSQIWHIREVRIVACKTFPEILRPKKASLECMLESRLANTVGRNLAQVH